MPVLPPASKVFPESERVRVERIGARFLLLMEDCDELAEQHISRYISPDRTKGWGPPDVSRNALAHACHQMSNPGQYGRMPTLTGPNATELTALMKSLWPKKQHAQYLACGLGAVAILTDVDEDLVPRFSVWAPHDLWAEAAAGDPTVPVVMRRIGVWTAPREGDVYVWAEWDVRDPAAPRFRWVRALDGGQLGADVTEQVIGRPALTGADYYWRNAAGAPFLPWSIHRNRDDGTMWNHRRGRAAAVGTLNGMLVSSFALKIARDGTGKSTIVGGLTPNPSHVKMADDGSGVLSVTIEPGDVLYHSTNPDEQPFVAAIGGADDLPVLATFANDYDTRVATDLGAVSQDIVRVGANPMSGSALFQMNSAKRAEQQRALPFCLASDLETLHHAAWLAGIDPTGTGITYHEIPKSPDELRQEQEADAFEVAQGLASPVDIYMRRHPGLDREQAIAELVRIRAETELFSRPPTATPGATA